MLQNIITDLVCINCNANLMADLAEDGALFDTALGNGGTTGNQRTGFECLGVSLGGWLWLAGAAHIAKTTTEATCKECNMAITWNSEIYAWQSADGRSCMQVGATIYRFYQQHEPA